MPRRATRTRMDPGPKSEGSVRKHLERPSAKPRGRTRATGSRPQVAFGLVGVSEPGNAGAAARTLTAFGFDRLLLIEPRKAPGSEDRALAVRWGRELLEGASLVARKEIDSLLADFDVIWGTTARAGRHRRLHSLQEAAKEFRERASGRLLVLVGPERDGLDRAWLDRCHRLVRIPTPGGPLNLAHAVTIAAYELSLKERSPAAVDEPSASSEDRREIVRRTSALLAALAYPTRSLRRHPPEAYLEPLRTGPLSRRQARWMLGLIRRLEQRLSLESDR